MQGLGPFPPAKQALELPRRSLKHPWREWPSKIPVDKGLGLEIG